MGAILPDVDDAAQKVREWLLNYLAAPHAALGRPGHVCPYVAAAMTKDAIAIEVTHGRLDASKLSAILRQARLRLCARIAKRPELRPLYSLVCAFPDFRPEDDALLEAVQRALKPEFVAGGLMIGDFHPRHERAGLHNPAFRALRSPMHLLVVRELVRQDIRFLTETDYPAEVEEGFLAAYLARFGQEPSA